MAKARQLNVKFGTEGFTELNKALKTTAGSFEQVLKTAQEAGKRAAQAAQQAMGAGDAKGLADALKQQEQAAKAAARAINASYRELGVKSSESLNKLKTQAIAAFEAIKNSGTASARDIAAAQAALNQRLRDLDDQLEGINRTTTNLGSNLKLALVGGVVAIAGAFASLGRSVFQAGSSMEQFRISLEVLLKSKERADQLIADLKEFTARTPFELSEVGQATKSLLAMGFSLEDVKKSLQTLGDVAAGSGNRLDELASIYGKVRAGVNLYAEDLNQLSDRGIPILAALAREMKVGEDQVKKLASEGKVSFDILRRAFETMTSEAGLYFGSMQKQSETTAGRLSTLNDKLAETRDKLFLAFAPAINGAIDLVNNNLGALDKTVQTVVAGYQLLVRNGNLVIAMLAGLTAALAVTRLVAALTAAITALTSAMQSGVSVGALLKTAIAGISSPANLAATGIGILTAAIIKFSLDAKQAREDALNLADSLDTLAQKSNNQALTELEQREANARRELARLDADIARVQRQLGEFSGFERSGGYLSNVAPALRQELTQLQRERADVLQGLQGVGATRQRIQNNILDRQRYGPNVPAGFGRQQQRQTTAAPSSSTPKKTSNRVRPANPQNQAERRTQLYISGRTTQIERWRDESLGTVQREFDTREFDLRTKLASATDDERQIIEDKLKFLEIEREADKKRLELEAELAIARDTAIILQREKRKLTEDENRQLEESLYKQREITKEIENQETQTARKISLLEAEIIAQENAKQSEIDSKRLEELLKLRQDVDGATVTKTDFESRLGQLLDLMARAEELGDEQAIARLQAAIDALSQSREQALRIHVEELVKADQLSQLKGEELAIAQELNQLQEQYDQRRLEIQTLIFQAILDGNQDAIKTLEDLLERTDKLKLKQEEQIKSQFDFIRQLSDTVKQSAQQATEQALADLFTLSKGLGDIFRDFATSVLRSIAQLAAQQATKAIFKAIGLGFADGGLVRGAGTGRSDSIPARLSNGEFVMTAESVKYWGTGFMDSINSMRSPQVAFAGAQGGSSAGFARTPPVNVYVTTPDANSFRRSEGQIGRDAAEQLRRSASRNG